MEADGFDCEYNAPQFVDFENLDTEDPAETERYFEFDHEQGGIPLRFEDCNGKEEQSVVPPTTSSETSSTSTQQQDSSSSACEDPKPALPPVIAKMREDTPKRRSLREAVNKTLENVANSPKLDLPRRSGTPKRLGTNVPAKPRLTATATASSTESRLATSGAPSDIQKSPAVQRWHSAITKVSTPDILRRARALCQKSPAMQQQDLKKRLKTQLVAATASDTIATSSSTAAQPYCLRATKPSPFRFATDERLSKKRDVNATQQHHQPMKTDAQSAGGFLKMLRSYQDKDKKNVGGVTKPQPFKFASLKRRSRSADPSPSRLARIAPGEKSASKVARVEGSHQQHEQPNQMSASKKPPAEVKPFSFVDRDLAKVKEKAAERKQAKDDFLNFSKSLRGYTSQESVPACVSSSSRVEATIERLSRPLKREPQRPHHHRSQSAEPRPLPPQPRPAHAHAQLEPKAHSGVPQVAKMPTVIQPFSFHSKDQERLQRKHDKIQRMLEEERKAREFRAREMPNLNRPVGLPIKEVIMPTESKPFDLEVDRRGEAYAEKWKETVEAELKKQREAAVFKAQPHNLHKEPFVPKPSTKPLVEISNVELHSDRRAVEREQFDMIIKKREAEIEANKRQLEERRRQEEEEEVRRVRREAVHKAQPVKHYKPLEIYHSTKPVTEPVSPKFSKLHRESKRDNAHKN